MVEYKGKKERSPNFPFINLESALERARQFWDREKRNAAPFRVAVGHWGYGSKSSGALQTAAALKSYGLLEDEGRGGDRTLRVSDLGRRILLDEREISPERSQLMREAALSPHVIAEIYAKWPNELPSDANLRHYLVLDRGFNETTAVKALKIIRENQELVGSYESHIELQNEDYDEDTILAVAATAPGNKAPKAMRSEPVTLQGASERARVGISLERIIAPGAEIVLQFTSEPTWETYDFLEKYVALRKSVLPKEDKK